VYPFEGVLVTDIQKRKEDVQKWIRGLFKDRITKFLLKNSCLTKKQLETLLIDILVEKVFNIKATYEEKASFRISQKKITRGAFNRTLRQARKNVIKSIYTVILLGYLGILDDSSLYPYLEISNKIKEFKEQYERDDNEAIDYSILNVLKENIEDSLNELSRVKALAK